MGNSGSDMITDVGTTRIPAFDGARLQAARDAKGWTRGRLAIAVGKTVVSVSSWERGQRTPEPDNLVKLAEVLGVEPADLLSSPRSEWGIAEFRMVRGLKQAEVAEAVGIPTPRMSHIEMTYDEPDDKLYIALAQLYGGGATAEEIKAAWERSRDRYTAERP